MNSDEIQKLAEDEAQLLYDAIDTKHPMPMKTLLRDAVLRGMAIGSRMATSQAESYLAMMKAGVKTQRRD